MAIDKGRYKELVQELGEKGVTLVAVSKTKPVEDILALYDLGQRDFGENYVQELVDKQAQLPQDIRWHFIGHLQGNKVKYITPFVPLIHGIDSYKLLKEVSKQGEKIQRNMGVLLQVHIAQEETKFGLDEQEVEDIIHGLSREPLPSLSINGLMGMASFSDDKELVRQEFSTLKVIYDSYASYQSPILALTTLSMGMSGDYKLAIEEGSTMVRIGSLLFGARS